MAQAKDNFKVGDRVTFLRSHDKTVRLEGRVVRIHDNADDCVDIETIPDGKLVEVETIETAHAADVKAVEAPTPQKKAKKSKAVQDEAERSTETETAAATE